MEETNPYNQSITFEYDAWNRLIKSTDFLGKSIHTDYVKENNQYTTTITGDDGSVSEVKYDALGRTIYERTKIFGGRWSQVNYTYDALDRVNGRSEPHGGSSAFQWNTITYDLLGRVRQQNLYTGKVISMSYDERSITQDDGIKTVSSTTDAMGNVIRMTDPGGTIEYAYFGNGNLKTSTYQGLSQILEQDEWGRKVLLYDPSAGVHTYEYNGFGELLKQITPSGTTTYTYNDAGRMLSSKTLGSYTNISTYYTYDNDKLLTAVDALDRYNKRNYQYTYDYDVYKRPREIVETTNETTFRKEISYDNFSRVTRESYKANLGSYASETSFTY